MKLLIRDEADVEIAKLAGSFGEARTGYGGRFLDALAKTYESIQEFPTSYARWEFGGQGRHLRRAVLRKFKVVVVFKVREATDEIEIFAVFPGRRNPRYWIKRLRSDWN